MLINWGFTVIHFVLVPASPLPKGTDVIFLLDSSRGVTPADFQLQKQFVKTLFYHFNISQSGTRAGAVTYAAVPNFIAGFTDIEFSKKLNRASPLGTPRRIDKALEYAAQLFNTSGRKGPKIAVLLTAGRSSVGSRPLNKAIQPLRNLGAQTFLIAIGNDSHTQDLAPVVDTSDDIFKIKDIGSLPIKGRPIAKEIREKSSKLLKIQNLL